jgi:adenylyl cyclase-associated protein
MANVGLHFAHSPTTTIQPTADGNPLNSLIRRLEAATSRLEDIAQSSGVPESQIDQQHASLSAASGAPASNSMPELTNTSKNGSREASTASTVQAEQLPASIEEMDELLKGEVADFQESSKGLDPLIEEQVCIHTAHIR